jgi:uncharacterized damage-inducible protein DinB
MDTRTPGDFGSAWRSQTLRCLRLVLLFDDHDLALVPGPGAMSLAAQLGHLVAAAGFTAELLESEHPTREEFSRVPPVPTVRDGARLLVRQMRRVCRAADAVPLEWWENPCPVLGRDWNLPRRELAFLMLEHAVHHTGALHVYARIACKVPPKLYSAVDEASLLRGLE